MTIPGEVVERARDLVESRLGLDLSGSRRPDLERALAEVIEPPHPASAPDWLGRLAAVMADGRRWQQLVSLLTVGESFFFRDPEFLRALEETALLPLIGRRRAEGDLRLRIWSAGCAAGEEPYSLAILVDGLLPDGPRWDVRILATDVDTAALEAARRAIYRDWALRETPSWIRQRCFAERGDGSAQVVPRIRAMVDLAPLNLVEDLYPSPATGTADLDLIVCRNVLMYLTGPAQESVAGRLARSLAPGGWLAVTAAESCPGLFGALEPAPGAGGALHRRSEAGSFSAAGDLLPEGHRVPASAPGPRRARAGGVLATPARAAPRPRPAACGEAGVSWHQRARSAADSGDLAAALRLCERALAEDPLDAEARLLMAAIHHETGSLPAAEEELRKAVFAAPDSPVAHFLLGSALLGRGERARARGCFAAAVALLGAMPADALVPGSDGFTAGRLREAALAHLEAAR